MHSYYGDLGHAYPSSDDSVIVGLCTGLLPSVAVSSSKTAGELIPIAVQTVVLALRLGLCVHSVRKLVDTGSSSSTSWSALVSGISESEALEKIQEYSSQQVSSAANPHLYNEATNKIRRFLRLHSLMLALFPPTESPLVLLQQLLISLSRNSCPRIISPCEFPSTELTMRRIYMMRGMWRESSLSGQTMSSRAMYRTSPCSRATRESPLRLSL